MAMEPRETEQKEKAIRSMTLVSVAGNAVLAAFKFAAGLLGQSAAMISDAVHSLSDVLSTFIALIGVRVSQKEADSMHPYGHERFECVASLLLGCFLAVTGAGIGYEGLSSLLDGSYLQAPQPGTIALVAAAVSILSKEAMYRYVHTTAQRIKSEAFEADAWHHRTDAFSSIGALAGIGATMLGFPAGDSLASVVISLFILKAAWDIVKSAIDNMVDTPCSTETENAIRSVARSQEGVVRVDALMTRRFGNRAYVDLEIAVDPLLTVAQAHDIAQHVHDHLEKAFPQIKHVMVHVNPA